MTAEVEVVKKIIRIEGIIWRINSEWGGEPNKIFVDAWTNRLHQCQLNLINQFKSDVCTELVDELLLSKAQLKLLKIYLNAPEPS